MRGVILVTCVLPFLSPSAEAHFVWINVSAEAPQASTAKLTFGESTDPGEAHLVDKVAKTKLWRRELGGAPQELALTKAIDGEQGWFAAPLGQSGPCSVEAYCDYGVFAREGKQFLLQYYAKHLVVASAKDLAALARAEKLTLDVVPHLVPQGLELHVLFNGKPASEAQVVAIGPDGEEQTLQVDKDGKALIEGSAEKTHAIRAGLVEAGRSGSRDGKDYNEVRHYSTLTLKLPSPGAAASTQGGGDGISAAELLQRARGARAVWQDFHGFEADVMVRIDGKSERGHVAIDGDGEVDLKLSDPSLREWAEEELSSLVQHRMPAPFDDEDVAYADDVADHPLGRKINLGDKKLESVYRIKDDVVTEVSRKMGSARFTISVMEVFRNPDGKHLPSVFTMTVWNRAREISSTRTATNTWQRIGHIDVPAKIVEIYAANNTQQVRELEIRAVRITSVADGR